MNKKLSKLEVLALGGGLFSMHFGASSMIWPMTWGKESASSVVWAFLGAYITAVFIPLLGYFALSKGGSFLEMSERVSKNFAAVFCNITILVLGPLFVIPRMSAAAFSAFLQITGFEPSSLLPVAIFSLFYYLLVFWFVSSKDNIMDKISRLLLPVLLLVVTGVVTKGLIRPISSQGSKLYSQPAFIYGLLEGYSTVELPTALLLGGVIVSSLKFKGLEGENLSKTLVKVGIIGTSFLSLSHFLHMYIGSNTLGFFEGLKYSQLYAAVVVELWGVLGGIIFNVGLLFAALSCAVGLSSATAHFYNEYSRGSFSYKKASIFVVVLSAIVSVLGLDTIVKLTSPLLKLIYPPAIVITICHAFIGNLREEEDKLRGMKWASYGAIGLGALEGILEYMELFSLETGALGRFMSRLILADMGLAWIPFSLVAFIIGKNLKYRCKKV